jgi:murein DD-endopeptidase MepM/ murein hydrolase activator NlpD
VCAPNLKSSFLVHMVKNNRPHMDGFHQWIFHPGMRFSSWETWWGDKQERPACHEGIDLYSFEDSNGILKTVDENTKIPAAFAGKIVKITNDFLGKSIYIRHEIYTESGRQLYTAYGHTAPLDSLEIGKKVAEGEIIAYIAGFPGKKTSVSPHVHITLAWIPPAIYPDQLNWNYLSHVPTITLIDPLPVIDI